MKMKSIFLYSALLIGASYMFSACNKKKDTIGKVYVYDENKNPVSSCQVVLYPKPTEGTGSGKELVEADTALTNASGEAIFNLNHLYQLGQAGVAVLNIKATKDALSGDGIIQIVEEETSEADVVVKL